MTPFDEGTLRDDGARRLGPQTPEREDASTADRRPAAEERAGLAPN